MRQSRLNAVFLASIMMATAASRGADSTVAAPTTADLQSQVNALQSEVQDLKAQEQKDAATTQAIPSATTQAAAPSTNAANFVGVGWNPTAMQFYAGSPTGNFYFHPGVIMQARYVADHHRTPDKWQNSFELRCC